MLIDSHCHLDSDDFEEDFEEVLARAREAGVTAILNAGNSLSEFDAQLAMAKKYPFVYCAVGVHPHNASEFEDVTALGLVEKAKNKKVAGIGECGLDYYYNHSPKDIQQKVFIEHIHAAQESKLPLILHARDADEDVIEVMGREYKKAKFSGAVHCFSSSKKLADFALEIGFYLSASGIITFNKSQGLRDIFAEVPMDRLLVETDAPFLAPVPRRGRRNEPSFVVHTAEKLANIKQVSFEEMAQATSDNFYRLFRKASDKGRYDYVSDDDK